MRFLEGHTGDVMAVAFSPAGDRLATAGWDGSVRLWDCATGEAVRKVLTPNEHATAVAFSPDGQTLAAGYRRARSEGGFNRGYGTIACFPVTPRPGEPADSIRSADTWSVESGTRSVQFHHDGQFLLTSRSDSLVQVWDWQSRDEAARLVPKARPLEAAVFRPDGGAVAAACSESGEGLFVWNRTGDWTLRPRTRHGYHPPQPAPHAPHGYRPPQPAPLPPPGFPAPQPVRPRASDWWFRRTPHLMRFPGDRCWGLAYSPDGQTLAGAFDSGRVVWWRPGEKSADHRKEHNGAVRAVTWSPDGRLLLSAGVDGLIHLWDNESRSRLTTFDWRIGDVRCVAFAPDGLTAAAGGNGPVVVWDIDG